MTLKGHIRRLEIENCPPSAVEHYQTLDAIFDLFRLLSAGKSDVGIFGEDLLDWLNRHYVSPTSQQGINLADQERPWLDEDFWPTLTKYTLRGIIPPLQHFLRLLSSHPSKYLQSLAPKLSALLEKLPRATTVSKIQFQPLRKRWLQELSSFRSEFDGVPQLAREDWWAYLTDILDVLDGDEIVIKRLGRDLGFGWREIVSVWGLWGDEKLERDHLPELVGGLLGEMPPDEEDLEEMMLIQLFSEDLPKALDIAMQLDPWLGAHLADILQNQELLDAQADDDTGVSLRDQCVFEYAESILSDPGQWMIAVAYMQSCGPVGLRMADEILLRTPLDFDAVGVNKDPQTVDSRGDDVTMDNSDQPTVISSHVLRLAQEHNREWVIATVTRIAARQLADRGRLGEALSYSLTSGDRQGIDRVVNQVMENYLETGPDALLKFINEIPPSLHTAYRHPGPNGLHSLAFLLNYTEFQIHRANGDSSKSARHLADMFRQDIVPTAWWAALLVDVGELLLDESELHFSQVDAYELLRRVEEVAVNLAEGTGDRYLGGLGKSLKTKTGGEKEALKKLELVRFAFANYFARLTIQGASQVA
ncbi:hypothetical protein SISNIDRAFT_426911 [Sistotremastrum niveocremeum HHB9708]|uniref:Nuclear pore complex protein Nup85 n=1 Tax=Sistotremastrum niveocremeum HHB9708 TaxID=1314777 RepID=A0A164VYI8_9AGAM|nr:hypothetical protein SISNIDRAFT_426911 [Sistotremastrum niveocremeum HHB9708]